MRRLHFVGHGEVGECQTLKDDGKMNKDSIVTKLIADIGRFRCLKGSSVSLDYTAFEKQP